MNIPAITYSNYQPGFIYAPASKTKSDDTGPVVNTDTSEQNSKTDKSTEDTRTQADSETTNVNRQELTQAEIQLLEELKQVDTEVRRHEMAHIAAGGRYITSGANFTYKRGPDGKNYAVGGEVSIDTSPVPGDPEATIRKMRQVKTAALAPANPSSQDLKVASKATSTASKALSDLMVLQAKEQANTNKNKAFKNLKSAADSYERVSHLPEEDTPSFQIAV